MDELGGFFRNTFTSGAGVTIEGYINPSDPHPYYVDATSVAIEKVVLSPTPSVTSGALPGPSQPGSRTPPYTRGEP